MTKIYRSRTDRQITGLCGGLAELFGIDATLLRLLVVIAAFFSAGVVIPLYFLAALVIPNEPYSGGPYGGGPGYASEGGFGHKWGSCKDWKRAEKHYRKAQKYGWAPQHDNPAYEREYAQPASGYGEPARSSLDDMMKDIEKKALRKEIEELRAKVAQYEKQQNQPKGDV
ncbi:PspC domain-containing protein [Paenibacillus sp. JMULE4]|uniref:PspC domain-containing protein n=1 Tax=Paenibacillus sp. JMULE4 TaxID=2518342 RepID=UPI0015757EC5|nr:PspC domain-containing protein [Paenibacillus sp. JMULE4]NTZ19261.1 PspC domain-containing protein [Paenibacillus sp. JMULE4]